MNSLKLIFIAMITLTTLSGWAMDVDAIEALIQRAEKSALERNGAEIYKIFAEVFVDKKMYNAFEYGIDYKAIYDAAENKIEGSATRDGLSMTFTLRQNGDIEGRDHFNLGCINSLERHLQVAESLGMIILSSVRN